MADEQGGSAFVAELQRKIDKLLQDFQDGVLSREQFYAVYEHYMTQRMTLEEALATGRHDAVDLAKGTGASTDFIKESLMAKPLGVAIYDNQSSLMVETLGLFDVPAETLNPLLDRLEDAVAAAEKDDTEVEPIAEQIGAGRWLFLAVGKHTRIVTLFQNEPSRKQRHHMQRLHSDFEHANALFFLRREIDPEKLAYPFLTFLFTEE